MITIDGSNGGGQVLRTALALSLHLLKPFKITNIRGSRPKPGLRPQHLKCVEIAKEFSDAYVDGGYIGSTELTFIPKKFNPKSMVIDIGTAGSITLLLQSIFLPIALGKKNIKLEIHGGTDVAWSMPIDYFSNVVLGNLREFIDFELKVIKRGFYPKGRGIVEIRIKPKIAKAIDFTSIGELIQIKGIVFSTEIKEKMAEYLKLHLNKYNVPVNISTQRVESFSSGTGIVIWGITKKEEKLTYIGADYLVKDKVDLNKISEKIMSKFDVNHCDTHFTDNIIPFIGVLGGSVITGEITDHIKTNMEVTELFTEKIVYKPAMSKSHLISRSS